MGIDFSFNSLTLFLTSAGSVVLVTLLLKWLNRPNSNDNNNNKKNDDNNYDFLDAVATKPPTSSSKQSSTITATDNNDSNSESSSSVMPKVEVDHSDQVAPDVEISLEELAKHTGSDETVWIGINGWVYDVTSRRDMYSPGSGYSLFAGKDATRCLAKSSLKEEDLEPRGSLEGLTEKQLKTLKDWEIYYRKRYLIVGRLPSSSGAPSV